MQLSEKKLSIEIIENNRIAILVNSFAIQRCQVQMILNQANLEILFVHTVMSCEFYKECEKSLENLIGKRVEPDFPVLVEKVMDNNGCLLVKELLKEVFNGLVEIDLVQAAKSNACETCQLTKSYR